ncbi:MAG: His/Gly/Thr/Pro-type tRNA ligase C-terminal domain-containing protein, partial [Anaerolineales bacterium]
ADVFVPIFNEELMPESLRIASELRKEGFRTEWYPEPAKLQRQFKYADRQAIPVAVIIGPDEMENDLVTVKDLRDGTQETLARSALVEYLRQKLQV